MEPDYRRFLFSSIQNLNVSAIVIDFIYGNILYFQFGNIVKLGENLTLVNMSDSLVAVQHGRNELLDLFMLNFMVPDFKKVFLQFNLGSLLFKNFITH